MSDHLNSTDPPTAEKVTPASENATPAPWRIHTVYPSEIYATVDEKRSMVADIIGAGSQDTDEANAAFIVRAVNAHDALIKALSRIAQGTPDDVPPFRAMPREYMQQIAREALKSVGAV